MQQPRGTQDPDAELIFQTRILSSKEVTQLVSAGWGVGRSRAQASAASHSLMLSLPLYSSKLLEFHTCRCMGFLCRAGSQSRMVWLHGHPRRKVTVLGFTQHFLTHWSIPSPVHSLGTPAHPQDLLCAGRCTWCWRHRGNHAHKVLLLRSKRSRTFYNNGKALYHTVQFGNH